MSRNRESRWRLPTLASYQGQYFYMALVLIMVLIFFAWMGLQYVKTTSGEQISRIGMRAEIEQETGALLQELREIQGLLGNQLIEPGKRSGSEIRNLLRNMENRFAALSEKVSELNEGGDQHLQEFIPVGKLSDFRNEITSFLHISGNSILRFPGIYIIQTDMLPKSRAIHDALNSIVGQMVQRKDVSEFTHLVYQARHTWQQVQSEVNLLVANRFSVFSDNPEMGIEDSVRNIDKYLKKMQQLLLELEESRVPKRLSVVEDGVWQRLLRNVDEWRQSYQDLLASLHSQRWREDMYVYKSSLLPHIRSMQTDLKKLQDALVQQTADDTAGLTNVASRLSQTIFLLTVLGILWILFAYVYLRIRVIKPIADTAHALRQEANGNSDVVIPQSKLAETQDLQACLLPRDRFWDVPAPKFGTSQPPKSTRPLTTYSCPSRPGHQALRNNFASSLLLCTWLPMTGRRVRRPTLFSLWRKARRENSAASRLLGSTSLRFALHAWQREILEDVEKYFDFQ